MNTKQKLHQLRMNEWTTRFSNQKTSGLTIKEWCNQNNLSIHTYNYWKHALKEELASQILRDIIPIVIHETSASPAPIVSNDSALTNCAIRLTAKLTYNNISIEFDSDISEAFLVTIIKAVRHA